jgi:hypothetical protein
MKLKQFVVALAVRAVVLSHFVLAGSQTATYRVTLAPHEATRRTLMLIAQRTFSFHRSSAASTAIE